MLKYFLLVGFIIVAGIAVGQPSPRKGYLKRINEITELLKTDSLNDELIWERLDMQVNLLDSRAMLENAFTMNVDSINNLAGTDHAYDAMQRDFERIYHNIILQRKFDRVEEGDFYLNRMLFYVSLQAVDLAINDALYLRRHASYSRYSDRGSYYNDWALYVLFKLYVLKQDYLQSLEAINSMLEKKEKENPAVYFCAAGSFLNYVDKIELYAHFHKRNELIAFLVERCRLNFAWYFKTSAQKDYYSNCAKDVGFDLLKQVVRYMQLYNYQDRRKYRRVYHRLASRGPGDEEKINPTLSDRKLQSVLAAIF